ncbi:DEAD/DEAH box helicase [Radicibacter daui]|uniref:DEAD/DEAH box helicase n=1 Tax=Radicibacter daui TaxID=3064829 RepID=UPI0040469237
MTNFADLGLTGPILSALADEKHSEPTPIQEAAIPHALDGKDVLGIAQTGTGKTAAFVLPTLQRLVASRRRLEGGEARAVILSPTRELAGQIFSRVKAYGKNMRLRSALVVGGAPMGRQGRDIGFGVDVLVATPGRLLDLMGRSWVRLDTAEVLILDEADQMLDLGFVKPIRDIARSTPRERQTMLFSATMPQTVAGLVRELLTDPVEVSVAPPAKPAVNVEQQVVIIEGARKREALAEILNDEAAESVIVFARTKRGADRLARDLDRDGQRTVALHGDMSQGQRDRALAMFRASRARIMVATDVAARGIDITGVTHVVNYDLPDAPESYVHRIGRTGRAGASGIAISLCAPDEYDRLRSIEKLISRVLPQDDRRHIKTPLGKGRPNAGKGGKGRPQQRSRRPAPRRQAA